MHNKVLVRVEDTYSVKERKSGILMANAAHEEAKADSPGFTLSEFIIRTGVIEKMPRSLVKAYDWYPKHGEIKEGDQVYWPIVNFFDYQKFKTIDGNYYIAVPYFDLHLKKVDGKPVPVNGYYLFSKEIVDKAIMEYEYQEETGRFVIEAIGEDVEFEDPKNNFEPHWEVGDVCLLSVPPFQLEAETSEEFGKQYFLAQKRHILAAW